MKTLGTVAEALVRQGLVARVRNPADRRSWLLTRTPAAEDALRAWGVHVDEVVRRLTAPLGATGALLSPLSEEERDRLTVLRAFVS